MNLEDEGKTLDVEAKLTYGKENGERPHLYMYAQSEHPQIKGSSSFEKVTIRDGRNLNMTIPKNGFQLINYPTSLRNEDFYSDDQNMITGKYYEEICAAAKKVTGAKHVLAFNHTVRNEEKSATDMLNKYSLNAKVGGYVHGVHTETACYSADLTFKHFGSKIDKKDLRGKYMIINVWRNISDAEKVEDNHLALLDCTSLVAPDDFILRNLHFENFSVQQYGLHNANKHRHRWVYFPNMSKNELLMFTQYDSDPKATARQTFHTAFKDSTARVDAPTRESIEVRLLCVFPEHEPNTCPAVGAAAKGDPEETCKSIINSLKAANVWPAPAKLYMRSCAGDPMKAMKAVVKGCVEKDYHGLGGASEEFQKKVLALLEENKDEVDRLMIAGFGGKITLAGSLVDGIKFGAKYVSDSKLVSFIAGSIVGALVMGRLFQNVDQQNYVGC